MKLDNKVIKWFGDRSISEATLERMKVRVETSWMPQTQTDMSCIAFDYYHEGDVINTKYRDGKKNFKLVAGAPKIFYNIDTLYNSDHITVVVVEGEIDALSFVEAGIDYVVSVPNGATRGNVNADYLDSVIDCFESKERIVLALDNDENGQNLQQEFIRRLGPESCYLADFNGLKDANEYLMANGRGALGDVVYTAELCPLDNVITAKDIQDDVEDFISNGFKPGFQIGLDGFDDIFSTYTGQFITVTGIPSSGKSDFVDRMCLGYQKNYGWKTAYASPENLPTFQHVTKLMRKDMQCMPNKNDIGTDKWNESFDWVNDNFYFIDMDRFYLDEVLAKGAELVKRKGIKVLVIDPFNKVTMSGKGKLSINDYTMEYLQKIDEFCRKYDVLTIVVAHPTKQYKNPDGTIPEPTMYDIKGGGEWYDASYHGILVHRDYQAQTVKAKVLKVKFQNLGENGAEANFRWNRDSGDYISLATPSVLDVMKGVTTKNPNEIDLW